MTKCRSLGIQSSYAEGPTFLIIGNWANFLVRWCCICILNLLPCTRQSLLYSCLPSFSSPCCFLQGFLYLLSASLIFWTNSSTSGTFYVNSFPSPWIIGYLSRFTKNSQCLSMVCSYKQIWLLVTILPNHLVNSWHITKGIVPFLDWTLSVCLSVWGW